MLFLALQETLAVPVITATEELFLALTKVAPSETRRVGLFDLAERIAAKLVEEP